MIFFLVRGIKLKVLYTLDKGSTTELFLRPPVYVSLNIFVLIFYPSNSSKMFNFKKKFIVSTIGLVRGFKYEYIKI